MTEIDKISAPVKLSISLGLTIKSLCNKSGGNVYFEEKESKGMEYGSNEDGLGCRREVG